MTLPITSANILLRPVARPISAFEKLPAQTDATAKDERASTVGDILSQRMKVMQQSSRDMLKKMNAVSESRKAAARQRLELAKERIKMLKMLVASGLASKGVLREIRALAKEIGQAAKELSGDSPVVKSTDSADAAQTDQDSGALQTEGAEDELAASGTQVEAELEAMHEDALQADSAIDTEAAEKSANDIEVQEEAITAQREANSLDAYLHNQNDPNANQRRKDAEQIKEVLSLLKSLVEMVKNMGFNDAESRKELEKISSLLSETENIATDMAGGTIGGLSIGSMVSVSV